MPNIELFIHFDSVIRWLPKIPQERPGPSPECGFTGGGNDCQRVGWHSTQFYTCCAGQSAEFDTAARKAKRANIRASHHLPPKQTQLKAQTTFFFLMIKMLGKKVQACRLALLGRCSLLLREGMPTRHSSGVQCRECLMSRG